MNENNKLNELINNRLILKTEITKLTKDLDDVNSDIKLELELAESDFYNNIKGECISYKETTRNGFDSKKAKTYLNEEQLKNCEKVTVFKTLRVQSANEVKKVKKFVEKF